MAIEGIEHLENEQMSEFTRNSIISIYFKPLGHSLIADFNKGKLEESIRQNTAKPKIIQNIKLKEIPKPFYPILKGKLKTEPEYIILKQLPEEKLKAMKSFTVYNEHGCVEWPDPIDITGVNIDEAVSIRRFEVRKLLIQIEVYPDDSKKPPKGFKLNNSAYLTFNHCFLWKDMKKPADSSNVLAKLKKLCKKQKVFLFIIKAIFINYNQDTGSWTMKVDGF